MSKSYDLACTITGAAGFVGSHLVRALMEPPLEIVESSQFAHIRVFAVDKPGADWRRLTEFLASPDVTTHALGGTVSFHDYDAHQPLRSDFLGVDAVYHFAGIADPGRYMTEPREVMDLNLLGLMNILERITVWSDHRPRIIYSSTSEVYGKNASVPFDEEKSDLVFGSTQNRRWCYGMSKAVGEHYLRAYTDQGIRHTILRFFNFVGADIDSPGAGRVLSKMVRSALQYGMIQVVLPGTQTRTFMDQDEFVVPLVRALTMKLRAPMQWQYDYTLNLGSDREITMLHLAEMVAERVARIKHETPSIELVEGEQFYGKGYEDVPRRVPQTLRAERALGWRSEKTAKETLVPIIDAMVEAYTGARP